MPTESAGALRNATLIARLLQFGDSTFPVGGFSFSGGLESAIQKGVVTDTATLHAFIRTALEQAERSDGIALVAAHEAATAGDVDALVRIDEQVHVRKLSQEIRTMSVRMGKKLTEIGVEVIGAPLLWKWRDCIEKGVTPGCYPVALSITFAVQDLPALGAFAVHQYGLAATSLGAAMRLMKISHVETQKILYDVTARIEASYANAAATQLSGMSSYAPLKDILAAVHAKAHVRLFMN